MGQYEQALRDLAVGQKIDYDDGTYEVQKFVEPRVAKARERQRKRTEAARKKKEEGTCT